MTGAVDLDSIINQVTGGADTKTSAKVASGSAAEAKGGAGGAES